MIHPPPAAPSLHASTAMVSLTRIRDLIYKSAGIFQADNKLQNLADRCQKRMQFLGVASLRDYYDCLTAKPMHQAELVSLLNEITVGETCFFRNQAQLDGIRDIILPQIMEARSKLRMRKIRIWSAGCSTGEEPYTLAIMLLEAAQTHLKGWSFQLLATDLNERSVAFAKAGSYADYSVRNVSPQLRNKYFDWAGSKFSVRPEVRQTVKFNRMNLLDDARMILMNGMDLIVCCNVLIYFDVASKKKVLQHFYSSLLDHGHLLLGHAESLFGISDDFRLVHLPSATAYAKAEKRPDGRAGFAL